ncbi:tautomerase family protein [Sphingomonas sp. UYP23]
MPVVRISLARGKPPEYLAAVSASIYEAMRESYVLAKGDLFHIFEELDAGAFIYDREYVVREQRTDDFMIIQIVSDGRRNVEKTAAIKAICDRLGASPGVKPQDIAIVLSTSSTLEDFSLGYGESAAAPLV